MKEKWKSFIEVLIITITSFSISFILTWISTFKEIEPMYGSTLQTGAGIVMVGAIYSLLATVFLYPTKSVEE